MLSPRYEVPACAGMTEGGRGPLFSKQSLMLASSNTTTNENRRADADTWIPAFEAMTGGGVLDSRVRENDGWGRGDGGERGVLLPRASLHLRVPLPADGRGFVTGDVP